MKPHLQKLQHAITHTVLSMAAVVCGFLSGCSTPPAGVKPTTPPPPDAQVPEGGYAPQGRTSMARSNQEYRKDAASHLYSMQAHRIYKGRMPPMLQAVGVLNVDIDPKGQVKALRWMRAPQHVPQVMAEIERMVKAAAPYPVPQNLRQVTYTDVWLWHKSGQFQLDTLTEGQD